MLKIFCYQIVRDLERAEAFPDDCFLLPAAFHRPHPRKEADKGDVKAVRRFLEEGGIGP